PLREYSSLVSAPFRNRNFKSNPNPDADLTQRTRRTQRNWHKEFQAAASKASTASIKALSFPPSSRLFHAFRDYSSLVSAPYRNRNFKSNPNPHADLTQRMRRTQRKPSAWCRTARRIVLKSVHDSFDAVFEMNLSEVDQQTKTSITQSQLSQDLL